MLPLLSSFKNKYLGGWIKVWRPERRLTNHNSSHSSRHVRSSSCPRNQKSFPALVTVCTCETHLESRLNSSVLWFRLESRSNSKIGGNYRTHSSTLSLHFLCPDNPYSFLSLLSSAMGLNQGGCLHRAVWARCLSLSCHYTTLCKTQPCTSPHALRCHFSCWTPGSIMSILLFHLTGCSKVSAEWM